MLIVIFNELLIQNDYNQISQQFGSMKGSTQQFLKVLQSVQPSFTSLMRTHSKPHINLFGKGITHINPLSQQCISHFKQLQVISLDLSHNALTSIESLLPLCLQQVNLSHNKINDQQMLLDVMIRRGELREVKKVWLKGNPFLKRQIKLELKRWIIMVDNDLDYFRKDEIQLFQLLTTKTKELIILKHLFNKIQLNIDFIKHYQVQITQQYQHLLITRPQDYYKIIRRQIDSKLQIQPLDNIKRFVALNLPIQKFINDNSKYSKSVLSPLIFQLKNRQQNMNKEIKILYQKISSSLSSVLIMKKMNLQKKAKQFPKLLIKKQSYKAKSQQTPIKWLQSPIGNFNYPQINTPLPFAKQQSYRLHMPKQQIYIIKQPINVIKQPLNTIKQPINIIKQPINIKTSHNPFEQITRQPYQTKQAFSQPNKKTLPSNKTSKTLFQLSQSLLKTPKSNQSITFSIHQYDQDKSGMFVQKMFYQILIKANPIFHLLYSPLDSLKNKEKDSLITNLLEFLKQKLKQSQKLQNFKLLFQQTQKKYAQSYKNYEIYKQKYQQLNQQIEKFQQKTSHNQNQIHKLSKQLQIKTQQNMNIKNEVKQLQQKLNSIKQIKLTNQYQNSCIQTIIEHKQNRLKKQYLQIINQKAEKYFKFHQNMSKIKQNKQQSLLGLCFNQLLKYNILSRKERYLKVQNYKKYLFIFTTNCKQEIQRKRQINENSIKIAHLIMSTSLQKFRQNAKVIRQNGNKKIKCYKYNLKRQKLIIFKILLQNLHLHKQQNYEQMLLNHKNSRILYVKNLIFNQLLISNKQLLHKEIQIQTNYQFSLQLGFFNHFKQYHYSKAKIREKGLGCQMWLRTIRRIKYFHTFLSHVRQLKQAAQINLFKIRYFVNNIHFQTFLNGIRAIKSKRMIREKKQAIQQRKLQFNQTTSKRLRRRLNYVKLKNMIRSTFNEHIREILFFSKKQMDLQKNISEIQIKRFLKTWLSKYYITKSNLSKLRHLSYLSQTYHSSQSTYNLSLIKTALSLSNKRWILKKRVEKYLYTKKAQLVRKNFYVLRINTLQQRCQQYQQKLLQLGQDIQVIQQRQIQTNIQRVTLIRQIDSRNQQLQQSQRQVQQLNMLLEAKQIKYDKLKDIYAESVHINSFSQERNDDIQKTIRFQSKPPSKITKYSPERDIKKSLEKQKFTEYFVDSRKQSQQSGNINSFYPSFRRF